jgi:hypothetical protein
MGFIEVLTIVFIVLKLTEVIAWSWWLVFTPILAGYALIFVLIFVLAFAFAIIRLIDRDL